MREDFVELVCAFRLPLTIAFTLCLVFGLLAGLLVLFFLPAGSPQYAIAVLTMGINAIGVLISAPLLYGCRQRRLQEKQLGVEEETPFTER